MVENNNVLLGTDFYTYLRNDFLSFFDILLTVHLDIFILILKKLDALNFIMSLFYASTCFEHKCSSSGGQNCAIKPLVSSHL